MAFHFSARKSSAITFTRLHKPGDDPLLFMHGHRIMTVPKVKFLRVWFDYKLIWKSHIEVVIKHCLRLKNLFSAITTTKFGPNVKSLTMLSRGLVQSEVNYGLIAYGTACKTNLNKIDVVMRTIMRTILGSLKSTPVETLYADLATTTLNHRRNWMSWKYLTSLSYKPFSSSHATGSFLFLQPSCWRKFSTPCLSEVIQEASEANLPYFPPLDVPEYPSGPFHHHKKRYYATQFDSHGTNTSPC